ncbi:Protein of unknown function [Gryllus bimaculatus]|nr:Protein of unknown function [Gryllus bimaculatus]
MSPVQPQPVTRDSSVLRDIGDNVHPLPPFESTTEGTQVTGNSARTLQCLWKGSGLSSLRVTVPSTCGGAIKFTCLLRCQLSRAAIWMLDTEGCAYW